jgi:hypothetical protein
MRGKVQRWSWLIRRIRGNALPKCGGNESRKVLRPRDSALRQDQRRAHRSGCASTHRRVHARAIPDDYSPGVYGVLARPSVGAPRSRPPRRPRQRQRPGRCQTWSGIAQATARNPASSTIVELTTRGSQANQSPRYPRDRRSHRPSPASLTAAGDLAHSVTENRLRSVRDLTRLMIGVGPSIGWCSTIAERRRGWWRWVGGGEATGYVAGRQYRWGANGNGLHVLPATYESVNGGWGARRLRSVCAGRGCPRTGRRSRRWPRAGR